MAYSMSSDSLGAGALLNGDIDAFCKLVSG